MRVIATGLAIALWSSACATAGSATQETWHEDLPSDVDLRSKLAAGCNSKKACDALYELATARWDHCMHVSSRAEQCSTETEDRTTASRLQDKMREVDANARRERIKAQYEGAARESARLGERLTDLGSSCADINELESAAAALAKNLPSLAEDYRKAARQRREERVRSITFEINSHLESKPSLAEMNDPTTVRANVPATQALVEQLRCYDPAAAARSQAELTTWAAALEQAVLDEGQCRATPRCMADREQARLELAAVQFSLPLCEAIRDRRDALQDQGDARRDIARERGNPSGVVDLSLLHDLGERIQDDDERARVDAAKIAELKPKYASLTRKPFSEATCPKTP